MATSNRAALKTLQSNLQALGYFKRVIIPDTKTPPDTMTAALFTRRLRVPENTLSNPRLKWTVNIRLYARTIDGREEDVEFALDEAVGEIIDDICGKFTLGGNVAYLLPSELEAEWGWLELGGVWFRIVDIPVSYTIDDRAAFVP